MRCGIKLFDSCYKYFTFFPRTILIANHIHVMSKEISPNFLASDVSNIKKFSRRKKVFCFCFKCLYHLLTFTISGKLIRRFLKECGVGKSPPPPPPLQKKIVGGVMGEDILVVDSWEGRGEGDLPTLPLPLLPPLLLHTEKASFSSTIYSQLPLWQVSYCDC